MREAKGFLSEDNVFFNTAAEARRHDAEMLIRAYCVSHTPKPLDADALIVYIQALADPILEFVNADREIFKGPPKESPSHSETREVGEHTIDTDQPQEFAPVLEQPLDEYKSVPDLGSRSRSKSLREQR